MTEEVKQTRITKIYKLDFDESRHVLGKGYKEIVFCESDRNIWSFDEADMEFKIDKDRTIIISDNNGWVYITPEMFSILKEAMEIVEKMGK